MTMKKLVGAVAALTMAGSLLAGFTTVVNADAANEENNQKVAFATDMNNRKVTYYAEAEDLTGAKAVKNAACSGGAGAYFEEDTIVEETILMSGIYQIEAGVIGDGSKPITIKIEPIEGLKDYETEDFFYEMTCQTSAEHKAYTKDTIFIRNPSNIIITASNEDNLLDYIYITEPEVTVSARGVFYDFEGTQVRSFTLDFEIDNNHAPVTGIEVTVGKTDNFDKPLILEGTEKTVEYPLSLEINGKASFIMGIVVYNDDAFEIANPTAVLVTAAED